MHTGLPAAPLRQTPSAIRDDQFTRCPFPAATTDAPVAPVRSSNSAMEHLNCCTDLRHPALLAACCPYSSVHGKLVVQHPSRTKKSWKTAAFAQFQFFDPTGINKGDRATPTIARPTNASRHPQSSASGRCRPPAVWRTDKVPCHPRTLV